MAKKPKTSAAKPPTREPAASTKEDIENPYEPTPREQEVLEAHHARKDKHVSPPCVKVTVDGNTAQIAISHSVPGFALPLMMEALGTADENFLDGITLQLASLAQNGSGINEADFKFMLATVVALEPNDEVEAMLAAQMAAVHNATMTEARRLRHAETIEQQDSAERTLNRLARTFASQVEALQRYRGKGQQKMTVKHVHVHDGGQAIVGSVQGGGDGKKH